MSDTLEKDKTDIRVTDDGDHDRFQHYFAKKAIDENLMTGKPMRAICGKLVVNQVDPEGRTICSICKDIFENVMKP